MKAIMAEQLEPGSYCISPEAEPEDWEEVKDYAVTIQYLGPVNGFEPFAHAVRVQDEDKHDYFYLVETGDVAGGMRKAS